MPRSFLRSAGGKTLEQQDTSQILQLQTACSQLEDKMENAWQAGYIADMEISAFVGLESGYTDDFFCPGIPPASSMMVLSRKIAKAPLPWRMRKK